MALPDYAELMCSSNYRFLVGASHPEELVDRAHALGYRALAITDECSVSGVVRAHVAAKACGLPLLLGSQFRVGGLAVQGRVLDWTLVLLVTSLRGWGQLCRFITTLRRRSPKGQYRLDMCTLQDVLTRGDLDHCLLIAVPERSSSQAACDELARWLLTHAMGRSWLGLTQLSQLDDAVVLQCLRQSSALTAVPLVAVGDVLMHRRSRKPLQDVLCAVRLSQPLTACGHALQPNAERHLRTRLRLAQMFAADTLAQTGVIAQRCSGFSLDELRYQYPDVGVPAGRTPAQHLRHLAWLGAAWRWPQGVPAAVSQQIEHELQLITELRYEPYFLTVHHIVSFARSRGILCQGRGSAANSAVCFCLGITAVNPDQGNTLFERFISRERNEPPDIDVDFEHERREEVMQYIYTTYGRERAALTAAVISYQARRALREVGRALGLSVAQVDCLSRSHSRWSERRIDPERLREGGLDPDSLLGRQLQHLAQTLIGFPRHLSQHTGGFVLTRGPLCELVPIENAAMPDRTVVQWDKDDLDALGLLKVDVLALGMLSALHKALDMLGAQGGPASLHQIPQDCPTTYDMMSAADTVGVFQIESRAQMSMLPRLRPQCFYDLVIEVALVRPGPIQGGAVHPYLRRRQGLEPVDYPPVLHKALERTLGVPVFQEQCMQIAIIAAGFTPGEADGLRRAMAAWKRKGSLGTFEKRLIDGMAERGYEPDFAQRVVDQIKGFSDYGFPESHAASFALLVYASAWIKCHHPAVFLVALLNSQPMGFYSPSQLVQDAQRHGVQVRPVCVQHSQWDCTLETDSEGHGAVRLGLRLVSGLSQAAAQRMAAARQAGGTFHNTADLALRADIDTTELRHLASADALLALSGHRRQQLWDAAGQHRLPALLRDAPANDTTPTLPPAATGEAVVWDYQATGLSLRAHPLALLREPLQQRRLLSAAALREQPNSRLVRTAGLVTLRQQPGTAKGVMFVSLEDETGVTQVIVWRRVRERFRQTLLSARLLAVAGVWQRDGAVANLIAGHLEDLSELLGEINPASRDFH